MMVIILTKKLIKMTLMKATIKNIIMINMKIMVMIHICMFINKTKKLMITISNNIKKLINIQIVRQILIMKLKIMIIFVKIQIC